MAEKKKAVSVGLHNLRPAAGAVRKRIGRGPGSGHGKTAGRGNKGFWSRSGSSQKRGFEGGQMPLHRRVPKRGFTNIFRKEFSEVNVDVLAARFPAGSTVGPAELKGARVIRKLGDGLKVLGRGDIGHALTVRAHRFSAEARKKIEAAGGKVEILVIETFKNIFNVPDLRKRVLFTFGLLAVYRVGAHLPTPGIDPVALEEFFSRQGGSLFGLADLFVGGNLRRLTIFALGIMPYISASIILQLLTVIWPYLEKLSKEGEVGRKKITQYTRYGTIVLSIVQGAGIAVWAQNAVPQAVPHPGAWFIFMTVVTLTTGTAFIMWLGEQITERGIGNGISLIIFAGIVVGMVPAILTTAQDIQSGRLGLIPVLLLLILMVIVVAVVVFVERAQRRIPVQYARRVVGRRQYGGMSTHLPLKVNTGGVIPVIFASSVLAIPQMLASFGRMDQVPWIKAILRQLEWNTPVHNVLYLTTIIFFCYFYTSIIFNPIDTADNLKKYGGFIPGIRPGKNTAQYIDKILSRITLGGAVYLGLVALLPNFLINGISVQTLPFIGPGLQRGLPDWITQGLGVTFYFGGTSLLIVVGVAMDTVQQVESQLIMRHYDGFLKGSRVRGRRG